MTISTLLLFSFAIAVIAASSFFTAAHDVLDLSHWNDISSADRFHTHHRDHLQRHHDAHSLLNENSFLHQHHINRLKKSKLTCPECLTIIATLEGIVKSKASTNFTIDIVDAEVCDKVATKDVKLCKDVVALAFKTILPAIFKGLESLAWNIPQDFCSTILPLCKNPCCSNAPSTPQQLFLSFANSTDWVSTLTATWTTQIATPGAMIRGGSLNNNGGGPFSFFSAPESSTRTYTFGGWEGVIHTATITNLQPSTQYWYQVGSDATGWSQNYTFTTLSYTVGQSPAEPLRVFGIADMGFGGNSNQTLTSMMNMMESGFQNKTACVINFVGDLSYADGAQPHWDVMFRKFEPLFSRCFMQFALGNHELYDNFKPAKTRLMESMPAAGFFGAPSNATYYYQKIGTTSFFTLDSETAIDTPNIGKDQVDWAKRVLQAYPKSKSIPHLVFNHHRPLYCKSPKMQCGLFADILRSQVEDLYYENGADLIVNGHIHTKMNTWPVYKGKVTQKNYTAPTAPVYTIVGNPGNREGNSGDSNGPDFINYGYSTIGFTVLEFTSFPNSTKHTIAVIGYESATGKQLDQIVIEKEL